MESAIVLTNGIASSYGLGVGVKRDYSRRVISHNGEISGFTAENMVFPDDRAAVIVLVNTDSSSAVSFIGRRIASLLFPEASAAKEEQQARRILIGLQHGRVDRTLFSDNGNFYFSKQALRDFAAELKKLGKPQSVTQTARGERGGMTYRGFRGSFRRRNVQISEYTLPDGKIEQFLVMPAE
jgi:hypothetical protein